MRLTTFQRFEFSAAHQLRDDGLESRLHGRNFAAWVGVSGALQSGAGVIVPRADLRAMDRMAGDILSVLDYADLDGETAPLRGQPSTGENLAAHLWLRFTKQLGAGVSEVRLWETPNFQVGAASQAEVSNGV